MIRPLVAGNWKMNLDHVEAIHLIQQLGVLLRAHPHDHVDVMVLAPFVDLRSVTSVVEADRLGLRVGAQHVNPIERGAFTGEVSVPMLRRLGVEAVLVGHSERRAHFAMDDETVAATFAAVQRGGLVPLLCVGESHAVREAGEHADFVTAQVTRALAGCGEGSFVVAYEPVWAIGTGETASVDQIAEMSKVIRAALAPEHRESVPILYGGSVQASNVLEIAAGGRVNGFLVGGASLDAEEFVRIVVGAHDCYGGTR